MSAWGDIVPGPHTDQAYSRWLEAEAELMDLGDAGPGGDTAGRYDGQPVFRTEHGLVYDEDPSSADGCLLHPPASFLGLPDAPLVSIGHDPFADADAELQGDPPDPCPVVRHPEPWQGRTADVAEIHEAEPC